MILLLMKTLGLLKINPGSLKYRQDFNLVSRFFSSSLEGLVHSS